MKRMSLLALSSLLVLIPACNKNGNGCGTRCCPTTTTSSSCDIITTDSSGTVVEKIHQDEKIVKAQRPHAAGLDKEALEEAELEEVMTNK